MEVKMPVSLRASMLFPNETIYRYNRFDMLRLGRLTLSREVRRQSSVFFGDLAEVITHRGKRQAVGDIVRVKADQSKKVFPKLAAGTVADAERHHDLKESSKIGEQGCLTRFDAIGMKAGKTVERTVVILLWTVNILQNRLKASYQAVTIHFGNEIERAVGIIAGMVTFEPPFLLEPTPKLRVGQCGEKADHRERNCTLVNEIHLELENILRIAVETDDESRHNLHAVALDLVDGINKAPACVLTLLGLLQAFLDRRFNAEEYAAKSRILHHLKQRFVLSEIYTRLSNEGEGELIATRPFDKLGHQEPDVLFIPDKVVVDDKYEPSPTGAFKVIEFSEHLLVGLRTRNAAVDLDDIAEFTLEWAAARILNAHRAVLMHIDQVKIRSRCRVKRRPLVSLINLFSDPEFDVVDELRNGGFSLTHKNMIGVGKALGACRYVRAADGYQFPQYACTPDHFLERSFLNDHRTQEDYIGPFDIIVAQLRDIHIDEPPFPGVREHRGNGKESKRRKGSLFPFKGEGILETPVCVGENRIYKQDLHNLTLLLFYEQSNRFSGGYETNTQCKLGIFRIYFRDVVMEELFDRTVIFYISFKLLLVRMILDLRKKGLIFRGCKILCTGEVVEPGLKQVAFGHALRVDPQCLVKSGEAVGTAADLEIGLAEQTITACKCRVGRDGVFEHFDRCSVLVLYGAQDTYIQHRGYVILSNGKRVFERGFGFGERVQSGIERTEFRPGNEILRVDGDDLLDDLDRFFRLIVPFHLATFL